MNVHHLELFYYVAKHGGISSAVRNMPYGIQQPAVSGQIAQLEEFLGVTLFERRPFKLTPAGAKLFAFVEPFFSSLKRVADELQGGLTHPLRIGSSDIVLRDHLPELLESARARFPGLKVTLRSGYNPDLEEMLQRQEIDLAVTLLENERAPGVQVVELLKLPLILIVPKNGPIQSAEQLWTAGRIEAPLICLPPREPICRHFQTGLAKRGVEWHPSLEVSSLDLIETYVVRGFGLGLGVSIPKTRMSSKVRALPLDGFSPILVGVLWRGRTTPPMEALLGEMREAARRLLA